MKICKIIIVLSTLFSCQFVDEKKGDLEIVEFTDTVLTQYKRYSPQDGIPEFFEFKLIIKQQGDSLLSFSYYNNSKLEVNYDFNTKQGQFNLIQENNSSQKSLVIVDTFDLRINGEELKIFKYEIQFPPIDGNIGIFFSKRYGLIGHIAYSWGDKTVLTNWNNLDPEAEIEKLLSTDIKEYMERNKLIPPSLEQNNVHE